MFPNHPPTFSRFFAVFFVFCFFCTLLPLPVSVLLQLFAFFCSFEICMQLSAVHLGEMIAREIFCAVLCSRCSRVSIWKELEFSMSSAAKSVLFKKKFAVSLGQFNTQCRCASQHCGSTQWSQLATADIPFCTIRPPGELRAQTHPGIFFAKPNYA